MLILVAVLLKAHRSKLIQNLNNPRALYMKEYERRNEIIFYSKSEKEVLDTTGA
jgi:hypothetical protein